MNITVLGATGRTGRLLLDELATRGHTLTSLVRDPAAASLPDGVRVVVGHARDEAALRDCLGGADAVVSALGPVAKDPTLHRDTATLLVTAMPAAGVSRFVGISGAGIDVPGDRKSTSATGISWLIRALGGDVARDKAAEYTILASSDLDWTLVRPPRLTDAPATGTVAHDPHSSVRGTRISRADLADFVADVLDSHLYSRQAPFVAGS